MAKLRMPDGRKLIGSNLVPTAANVAVSGGQQAWRQMILTWDWSGWVKPQIDYLVGNGVGCNCIRIIGCNGGVIGGYFTQAAYDAKIMQVAEYCNSLGVYFYACGGGMDQDLIPWGTASANAAMADSFATTFLKLQALPNVVGIDLLQEIDNTNYTIANAYAMTQLVKGRGVTLPITCSTSEVYSAVSGGTRVNAVAAAGFDFLDVHLYPGVNPTPTLNYFNYLRTTYPALDIVIGEFGTSRGGDSAVEESFGNAVMNLATIADSGVRGALVWASGDQDNINISSGNCFGVYDVNFVIRQAKANVLRRYTGGTLAKCNALYR